MNAKPGVRFIRSLPIHLPKPHGTRGRPDDSATVSMRCHSVDLAAAVEGAFDAGPATTKQLIAIANTNSATPSARRALQALPDAMYSSERELWNDLARNQRRPHRQ